MGIKGVQCLALLAMASTALYAVSCILPMHKTKYFLLGSPISMAEMRTHSTFMTFPSGGGWLCRKVGMDKGNPFEKAKDSKKERSNYEEFCDSLDGKHDIQDVYMHFCTPVMKTVWPGMCGGLQNAYLAGIILIIAISFNAVITGMGVYLLYDYTTRKANPQYQFVGKCCISGGTPLMLLASLLYWIMVIDKLNSLRNWSFLLVTTSNNAGGSSGYIVLNCGLIVQMLAPAFYPWIMQEDREDEYFENKMLKQEGGQYYGAMGNGQVQGQQPMMMGMQPQPMGFGTAPGGATMMQGGMVAMQPGGFVSGPMTTTTMETTVVMTGPAATYNPGPTPPAEVGNRPNF
mmetsp:Transcript_30571/g.46149  ORF Transcript_30571/g.46149 Transcript_30571/m.46149 type:complete len:345 (-) Transcript_30571:268-1302(-)